MEFFCFSTKSFQYYDAQGWIRGYGTVDPEGHCDVLCVSASAWKVGAPRPGVQGQLYMAPSSEGGKGKKSLEWHDCLDRHSEGYLGIIYLTLYQVKILIQALALTFNQKKKFKWTNYFADSDVWNQ